MVLVASAHLGPDRQQQVVVGADHRLAGAPALTCGDCKHNKEQPSRRCCCCCSCFATEPRRAAGQQSRPATTGCNIKSHPDCKSSSDNRMSGIFNRKSAKILAISRSSRTASNQHHKQRQRDWPIDCGGKLNCASRASKQPVLDEPDLVDCAKCQLIARWTSAQARLTKGARRLTGNAAHFSKSSGQLSGLGDKIRPLRSRADQCRQQLELRRRAESSGDLRDCCSKPTMRHHYLSRARPARGQSTVEELDEGSQERRKSAEPRNNPAADEAEISSLTDSSIGVDTGRGVASCNSVNNLDNLSLSSCFEEDQEQEEEAARRLVGLKRPPSLRAGRRPPPLTATLGGSGAGRKLRPAPLPPGRGAGANPNARSVRSKKCQLQVGANNDRLGCDHSLDSGNSSGGDTNAGNRQAHHGDRQPGEEASRANPRTDDPANRRRIPASLGDQQKTKADQVKPDLLSESEVFSIEHFLRSHKSSIYVCGCMANLYLTSTQLVDNGRCSMPSSDGWQLSRTGVPVLTFDSGLTRNRNKRRLSINLAERGSGFVLWSDIIDHLSNYRAYQTKYSEPAASSSSLQQANEDSTCDTFHVMYLSSNHRIMVGLSFDDAKCARLFLRQVELVTSDPANISLTGPKLARRLASVGRLTRLLSGSRSRTSRNLARARKRSESGGLCHQDAPQQCELAAAAEDPNRSTSKPSKLKSIIQRRSEPTAKQAQLRIGSGCANELRFSTGVDNTWSTLKRAIRFGQHQGRSMQRHADGVSGSQLEGADSSEQEAGPVSFRPKPLASLAMSGKIYRTNKKLPRKCDISAPCLFQHVTKVDLGGLERLYSRSLVQGGAKCKNCADCNRSGAVGGDPCGHHGGPSRAAAPAGSHNRAEAAASSVRGERKLAQISSAGGRQLVVNQRNSAMTGTNTTTSSSSCYSSASISPASSECGAHPNQQQQQRHQQQPRGPRNVARPTPPKVPQRTSSTEPAAAQLAVQLHHQKQQQQQELAATGSATKIQAIIRELQAQTSAELVDAKRKLMADIADQVLARATSSSASSASSSASFSASSSSGGGAVSRL